MNINRVVIIKRRNHPDKIYLETNLIDPYGDDLEVKLEAPYGEGMDYCKKTFPLLSIELIDCNEADKKNKQFRI